MQHEICVKNNYKPIKQKYCLRNLAMQAIIDREVDEMLRDSIIEPS